MKFATSACVLAVAMVSSAEAMKGTDKIKQLIAKVHKGEDAHEAKASLVADIFDVAGFQGSSAKGTVALNVCIHEPKKVHLSKEEQSSSWHTIDNEDSALDTGSWKPAANGFRFKSQTGMQIHCTANGGENKQDRLMIQFGCQPIQDKEEPRFAKVTDTFWQSCPDGHVPYGWQQQWGEFNFPYYAVTAEGYYGCSYLTSDGYCIEDEKTPGAALNTPFGYNDSADSKPASLFSFDGFKKDDLMAGSHYYTSLPMPEKKEEENTSAVSGYTESEQPAENEMEGHAPATEVLGPPPGNNAQPKPEAKDEEPKPAALPAAAAAAPAADAEPTAAAPAAEPTAAKAEPAAVGGEEGAKAEPAAVGGEEGDSENVEHTNEEVPKENAAAEGEKKDSSQPEQPEGEKDAHKEAKIDLQEEPESPSADTKNLMQEDDEETYRD